MSTRIFTVFTIRYSYKLQNGYGHDYELASYLALITCFKSYENWVQREESIRITQSLDDCHAV